jgi:hypothetical protein
MTIPPPVIGIQNEVQQAGRCAELVEHMQVIRFDTRDVGQFFAVGRLDALGTDIE